MTANVQNQPFLDWLVAQGVEFANCGLHRFDDRHGGRGVRAHRNIVEHEVVISVPDDAVLMPETCSIAEELEDAGLSNASQDPAANMLGLVLAVMFEKQRGPKSRWQGYLGFLPDSLPGMPIYWKPSALSYLKGTAPWEKLTGTKAMPGCYVEPPFDVQGCFDRVVHPFLERHPQPGLHANRAYSAYLWALAMVSAYSFTIGADRFQAMVPMWDALNHITGEANVRLHHCPRTGALQMIATRPIRAHQQLVNCFGKLTNGELLRRYGFVETAPNPHDRAEIPMLDLVRASHRVRSGCATAPVPRGGDACIRAGRPLLTCGCAAPEARLRFLARHGLLPATGWFGVSQSGLPCAPLLEAARLLLLTDAGFAAFERRAQTWRVPQAPLLSDVRDRDVPPGLMDLLLQLCDDRLAAYGRPEKQRTERDFGTVGVAASTDEQLYDASCCYAAGTVRMGEMLYLTRFKGWLLRQDEPGLVRRCAKAWRRRRVPNELFLSQRVI